MNQNEKHEFHVVQSALLNGHLFHHLVPPEVVQSGTIADLYPISCAWINEVAARYGHRPHAAASDEQQPLLIVFSEDVRSAEWRELHPGTHLFDGDRATPLEAKWYGRFDVVNLRFPDPTASGDVLRQMIQNAFDMLRPGGYFQFLDRELLEFAGIPSSPALGRMKAVIEDFRYQNSFIMRVGPWVEKTLVSINARDSIGRGGRSLDRFQVIETLRLVSGTTDEATIVGGDASLEMRNIVLKHIMHLHQLSCLHSHNELRRRLAPEQVAGLTTQLSQTNDLDTAVRQLLSARLEDFRLQSVHPFILAQKG